MKLEDQLQQLPKPVLALLVIAIVIVLLFLFSPPHTLCDSQKENIQNAMAGVLFPVKVGKETMPGRIHKAMEVCLFGNSGGACYEYFEILKRAAQAIKAAPQECTGELLGANIAKYSKMEQYREVREGSGVRQELSGITYQQVRLEQVLWDGLEIMVQKAWGEAPPEPGAQRFGWFRESELNTFCHLRDVLIQGNGPSSFMSTAKKVYSKLPGELLRPSDPSSSALKPVTGRKANQIFRESEIYERSLLSVPCDHFR